MAWAVEFGRGRGLAAVPRGLGRLPRGTAGPRLRQAPCARRTSGAAGPGPWSPSSAGNLAQATRPEVLQPAGLEVRRVTRSCVGQASRAVRHRDTGCVGPGVPRLRRRSRASFPA